MKFSLSFIFLLLSNSTIAQQSTDGNLIFYYKKIIQILAHYSLNGRSASSIFEDKAAKFIYQEFESTFSAKPKIHEFTYQTDSNHFSKNIYYFVNNHADSTILIGAHYDHIGLGENRSRSYGKKGIHNGADDNASGVALMLAIAQSLNSLSTKKYNYVFVAYSAHEIGLFGSAAFALFCRNKLPPLALVINFDMVGRFDKNARVLNIYGKKTLLQHQYFFETTTFSGKIHTS
ncbi:M28 family peptidase [Lacihabitans sp. CS3-21]|nr:M28 family peptidase [Lacihabitans sp. CS3-21]